MSDTIAKLGIEFDSGPLGQAATALDKVTTAGKGTAQATTDVGKASSDAAKTITEVGKAAEDTARKLKQQEEAAKAATRATKELDQAEEQGEQKRKARHRYGGGGYGAGARANPGPGVGDPGFFNPSYRPGGGGPPPPPPPPNNLQRTLDIATRVGDRAGYQSELVRYMEGLSASSSGAALSLGRVAVAAGITLAAVTALAGGYYVLAGATAQAQDHFSRQERQLAALSGSTLTAAGTSRAIRESGYSTGLGGEGAFQNYLTMERAGRGQLGGGQTLALTQAIERLTLIAGGGGEAAKANVGRVAGLIDSRGGVDSSALTKFLDDMPNVERVLASTMGKSREELRGLAATGRITSEQLITAFLGAGAAIRKTFDDVARSADQASQRSKDATAELASAIGERIHASPFVQAVRNSAADLKLAIAEAIRPTSAADRVWNYDAASGSMLAQDLDRERRMGPGANSAAARRFTGGPRRTIGAPTAAEIDEFNRLNAENVMAQLSPGSAGQATSDVFADKAKRNLKGTDEQAIILTERLKVLTASYGELQGKIGVAADEQRKFVGEQIGQTQAAIRALLDPFMTFGRGTGDRAAAVGYGGGFQGRVSIRQQAIALADSQAQRYGTDRATELDAATVEVQKRANVELQNTILLKGKEIEVYREYNKALGQGRDAMIKARADAEAFRTVAATGDPTSADGIAQIKALSKVLEDLFRVMDEERVKNTLLGLEDQVDSLKGQRSTIADGGWMQRQQAAIAAGNTAERQTTGAGALTEQIFRQREALQAEQMVHDTLRNAQYLRGVYGQGPVQRRESDLNRRIEDAQRNVEPDYRGEVAKAMRAEDEAKRADELNRQTMEMERQIKVLQEEDKIVTAVGEERAAQLAVLQKKRELEEAGNVAGTKEYDDAVKTTDELARQQYRTNQRRQEAQAYQQIFDNLGNNIERSLGTAFEDAFRHGTLSAKKAKELISDIVWGLANDVFRATVSRPLSNFVTNSAQNYASQAASALGSGGFWQSIAGLFGGGGGAGVDAWAGGIPSAMAVNFARGGVFRGGAVVPFARGDVVTRRHSFPMAHGGRGEVGEAGTEGILPLRRDPATGQLGVQSGGRGGGTKIEVYDQRTSSGSQPVTIEEQNTPDGRKVKLLIRDEVRRQVAGGDLDKEMRTSYGVQRQTAAR